MKAEVTVDLKEGIFDPQGENIKKALHLLGFSGVKKVTLSTVYTIEYEGIEDVKAMCTRLLTNPVIHTFDIRKG
jgi:phosphoribosylformylglycinamidine synthase